MAGLNETPVPALLRSSGQFERLIARRGNGPGELTIVDVMVIAPGDSVWIMEPGKRHVFAPDLKYVRTDAFPSAVDVLTVDGGRAAVIAATIGSPDRAGFPLHLVDGSGALRSSFGTSDPTLDPRRLAASGDALSAFMYRRITPGDAGTIWAYNPTRFLLEQYDWMGRLVTSVRHDLDGWYRTASEQNPGRGDFKGKALGIVQSSSTPGVLWLAYAVRNANFTSVGGGDMGRASPWAGQHDLVVEAVDVRDFRVIAFERFPGISATRVVNAPDRLAIYRQIDSVFGTYAVHHLRLVR